MIFLLNTRKGDPVQHWTAPVTHQAKGTEEKEAERERRGLNSKNQKSQQPLYEGKTMKTGGLLLRHNFDRWSTGESYHFRGSGHNF